jgi:hypothetical protein
MEGWNQNGSLRDWLGGGVDSVGSGSGPVEVSCEHCEERSGSGASELVRTRFISTKFLSVEFTKARRGTVLNITLIKLGREVF